MRNRASDLLYELITEEVFKPFLYGKIIDHNIELKNSIDDFTYIHNLTFYKIEEDLTEDFEASGYEKYNILKDTNISLELTYFYLNGEIDYIDYNIKDYELFNIFITHCMNKLSLDILKRIKGQFNYYEK